MKLIICLLYRSAIAQFCFKEGFYQGYFPLGEGFRWENLLGDYHYKFFHVAWRLNDICLGTMFSAQLLGEAFLGSSWLLCHWFWHIFLLGVDLLGAAREGCSLTIILIIWPDISLKYLGGWFLCGTTHWFGILHVTWFLPGFLLTHCSILGQMLWSTPRKVCPPNRFSKNIQLVVWLFSIEICLSLVWYFFFFYYIIKS